MNRLLIFLFLIFFAPLAHGHGDIPDEALEATIALYKKMVEWTPAEIEEHSVATPSVKISGQTVYLNGAFWELSRGWIRVYYRELQRECDHCLTISEEEFTSVAQDQVGRSFLALKGQQVVDFALGSVEDMALSAVDLGARYGMFAFGLKLSAEAVETVLSLMAPSAGMHYFCNFIDALILFGTRYAQTQTRAFMWGNVFGRSGVSNLIHSHFISRVVKKAQRRVKFVMGPVEINEEMLKDVDFEGPNRWWGWADEGKRAAWIRRLVRDAERNGRTKVTLNRREFLGTRMKRYAFLKARKRGHSEYMRGDRLIDRSLNQSVLWMLEVQENILQRALIPKGEEQVVARESMAAADTASPDDIRAGLAREFSADTGGQILIDGMLRDIEAIFNPMLPTRVRYFQAAALESVLGGFVYGMYGRVLNEKGEMYGRSPRGIWNQSRLHWNAGKFGSYIYEWADFLRLAALQSNPEILMRFKYEAMESLLRIMDYFRKTARIADVETIEQLEAVESLLSGEFQRLRTFRPWVEKRPWRSWVPFIETAPMCRAMNEAVGA